MINLLDEEELMLASKLLVRDRGMSTIRLACEDELLYGVCVFPKDVVAIFVEEQPRWPEL